MRRLFQYQVKTEPVFVEPAAPDTSDVEFAATSPTLSEPVRPLINIALLVTSLFFVAEAEPAVDKLSWYQQLSEPVIVAPRLTPSPYVIFEEELVAPSPPPNPLTWYQQLSEPVRPLEETHISRYFRTDPTALLEEFIEPSKWYHALSEPVRPLDDRTYVQEPSPLTTTFLPGDADALREFIQLPDVVRLPERVTAPPSFFEPLIKRPGPADELLTFIQLPDVIRPLVDVAHSQFVWDTIQLPGDATELAEFIQLPDVIRPVPRVAQEQELAYVGEPIISVEDQFVRWFQPFSEPVRPLEETHISRYFRVDPVALLEEFIEPSKWYQALSEPVRPPDDRTYVQEPIQLIQLPGDATELKEFIQLADVVRPAERVAHTQFVKPTIRFAGDATELLTFIQLPDVTRPVELAVSAPFLFFDPFPLPTPAEVQLEWYQQLSEPVRLPDRAPDFQIPLPLTTTFLPGDADALREFIQLADVVRPVPRFTWDQYLRIDTDVLVPVDLREGWYQPLSEPVRPLERAVYIQEPIPLSTTFLPGDATELREFIQLPDVTRPVPRVAQDQHLAIDADVRIPIDLREGWFQALSEPVRPVDRATYVGEPIPLTTTFLPGDATRLREFIQLPDVVKLPARTPSDPFLFFDPEPLPDALDVFSDSWYQQFSEPVREPPQAIPSIPYEPVVQFPGDATELAEFIPVPDVVRPPDKAIPTGITPFAVKSVSIKWFQALSDPVWPIEHPVYVQYDAVPLTTTFLPGDADALREFIQSPDVVRSVARVAQEQYLSIDPDVKIPVDLREGWYQALSEPVRPTVLVQTGYYTESLEPVAPAVEPDFSWYQAPADVIRFPVPVGEGGNFQRLLTPQELLDLIPNYGYFRPFSIPVDLRKPRNPAALSQDYINPAFDVAEIKGPWIKSTTGVDGWAKLSEPADTWTEAIGPTSGWDKFTKPC